MSNLWWDLRLTVRSLAKRFSSTSLVLLTLGLGIGGTLAIFGVLRATLLHPLPYQEPEELVEITWQGPTGSKIPLSPGELRDLRQNLESFEGIAAYHPWTFNVTGIDVPERAPGAVVTANTFSLLGVEPAVGVDFASDGPAAPAQAILSHQYWQERFGGDESIVGTSIVLDAQPVEIVGVMPADFRFPVTRSIDLWQVSPYGADQMPRSVRFLLGVARRAPGASLEQTRSDFDRLAQSFATEHPDLSEGVSARVEPLRETIVAGFERSVFFLQIAVALVLVLACFNLAMLQLGRFEARRGEMAVRMALGARRTDLMRQSLLEGFLLGLGGAAVGVLVARLTIPLLIHFGPAGVHRLENAAVGWQELTVAVVLGMLAGALIDQIPFWARTQPSRLSQNLRATNPQRAAGVLRPALVVVQVAVTLTLLASFGLLVRSLDQLASVPLGFEADDVLVVGASLPPEYGDLDRSRLLFEEVSAKLRELPEVRAVAAALTPPMGGGMRVENEFELVGQATVDREWPTASIRPVSPGFFELMDIPVAAGRAFTARDDARARPVAVVNASMYELLNQDDLVGRSLRTTLDYGEDVGSLPHEEWEVIGVVGDVRQSDLEADETPAIYVSTFQAPWLDTRWLIETTVAPETVAQRVDDAIRDVLPNLPIIPAETLESRVAETLGPVRFQSTLLGAFAAFGLLLMAVGLYATLSMSVRQRAREIGLRMALGAQHTATQWMVVSQGLRIVVLGALVGLALSVVTGRLLASLLFGVTAYDAITYVGVALVILVTALAAAWLPARRATRLDPAQVLRST